jgi:hypothetical protein
MLVGADLLLGERSSARPWAGAVVVLVFAISARRRGLPGRACRKPGNSLDRAGGAQADLPAVVRRSISTAVRSELGALSIWLAVARFQISS